MHALLPQYHGVVQDFCLQQHSLTDATLQSVVNQFMAYDKDPWKGPVGKDGKPSWTPSASMAGSSGNSSSPYKALACCSFGSHLSKWCSACKDGSERCMISHGTSNKPAHHSKDCPILKTVRHKLVKIGSAEGVDAASQVACNTPTPALSPAPAPGA
jgi:hypothetical protein